MGSNKKLQVLLLLAFFVYLCVFAASSSIISDSSTDIDLGDKDIQHEHGTRNANAKTYAGAGTAYGSKIAHVSSTGRAHTGGSTGDRNNGGSGYLYSSGAASNYHSREHHGTSSCNRNCVGLFTFILTALASLVHLYVERQN